MHLLLLGSVLAFTSQPTHRRVHVKRYVFDFVKKGVEELNEFVERRAKEDKAAFEKLTTGLTKSREALMAKIAEALSGGQSLESILDALEEGLLSADIGFATTESILEQVRAIAEPTETDIKRVLRSNMIDVLQSGGSPALRRVEPLTVISVIGSNGMGKTTTIGKLAARLSSEGAHVLVAACDTFRAAAVDQVVEWAKRADVDVATPGVNVTSPSAAAFGAMEVALGDREPDHKFSNSTRPYDVVLVDTSGRLANNVALTNELVKIGKTMGTKVPGAPHETLLVVDAGVGRNAVDQARTWQKDAGVTGLVVTKLDGTSKAGFCVSVVKDLGIPVKLVGVGESLDDLRDFDPVAFVDSLLDVDDDDRLAMSFDLADDDVVKQPVMDDNVVRPPPPPTRRSEATPSPKKKKKKAKARRR